MSLTVNIYKSVDAFLYLPVYIAKELGIFDTILKEHHLEYVNVELPDSDLAGTDISAIQKMLIENHSNRDESISLTIADPMAILTKQIEGDLNEYDADCCVVIGSLISKLPFWAVNHKLKEFKKWEDLSREYNQIIHYEPNLITGFSLGSRIVKTNLGKCKPLPTSFGTEIQLCEVENANKKNRNRSVAITADIVSLVKSVNRKNDPLRINYCFSKLNYLSTGIITTKAIAEDSRFTQILIDIIEGIQKSILLVYSSEKIAKQIASEVANKINRGKIIGKINQNIFPDDIASILKLLSEEILVKEDHLTSVDLEISNEIIKKGLDKMNIPKGIWANFLSECIFPKDIDYILKLMREEAFYPADLNISKDIWDHTLLDLSDSIDLRQGVVIEETHTNFVNNSFILSSERSIAKQVGIDPTTFQEEINSIVKPIMIERDDLKNRFDNLSSSAYRFALAFSLVIKFLNKNIFTKIFGILILLILSGISLYFGYIAYKSNRNIDYFLASMFAVIPGGYLANLLYKFISYKKREE